MRGSASAGIALRLRSYGGHEPWPRLIGAASRTIGRQACEPFRPAETGLIRIFDVIVVGGGPTGEEASARLSDRGFSVALVEDRLIGGECGHWACIPSKALVRPPEVLAEARRVAGAREAVSGGPDVGAVLARRDEVIGA